MTVDNGQLRIKRIRKFNMEKVRCLVSLELDRLRIKEEKKFFMEVK